MNGIIYIIYIYIYIYRGECSFVKKTRNVQDAGGLLCIVMDNKALEDPERIVLMDDGTGSNIHIPTILIGLTDGEILRNFVTDKDNPINLRKNAFLVAEFIMYHPDDRVEYELWSSSANEQGLTFANGFRENNALFENNTLFTPHFVMWTCPDCPQESQDCYCKGEFCAPPILHDNIKGRDILDEDLKQICLYREADDSGLTWFNYIHKVADNCGDVKDINCREKVPEVIYL